MCLPANLVTAIPATNAWKATVNQYLHGKLQQMLQRALGEESSHPQDLATPLLPLQNCLHPVPTNIYSVT